MTRSAPVIVTAALLVLAGCTGTLAGDAGLEAGASLDQMEYPDGYEESGINNTTAAITTHQDELAADGGIVTITRNGSEREYERTVRIDADAERIHSVSAEDGESREEMYYENGTRYNFDADNEDVYDHEMTYDSQVGVSGRYVLTTADTFNWTAVNATVIDGTAVIRYEITGVDHSEVSISPEQIEWVNGTVLVDQSGRIHRFSYDISLTRDGEQRRYVLTYEVDSYGDVTVDRPDWVEEYREN